MTEEFFAPRGVLAVYMTVKSDVFFWVENLNPRYGFLSRDLSRIFLGHKVCLIEEISIEVVGLVCFWVENFDARYFFLGVKFKFMYFFVFPI